MKSPYVGTLVANDVVTAQFLVISKEIRQKKTGEPYLALHLADRTGELEAKMWDNVAEVMDTFDRDDFVKVKGLVQVYQNRSQFTVHRLRRLEEHEVDFSDFFPCSERDPDEMFAELLGIVRDVKDPHLRGLLLAVLEDKSIAGRYKLAPAAKSIHHACRGGLLEHVLSLCSLSRLMAAHYRTVDLDLLITGAVLHDIGKLDELAYARSFGYSTEGQLLGHIIIGLRMVETKLAEMPDFPPKLRDLLEHILISHHGELEFGSPKVPIFPEALLFHLLDNLDSKMDSVRSALRRDNHLQGEFTGWVSSLERVLLKKDRYFQEKAPEPVQTTIFSTAEPAADTHETKEEPKPAFAPAAAAEKHPPAPAAAKDTRPVHGAPGLPSSGHLEARNKPEHRPEHRPVANTLFGEKLQAVLERQK
jgi:3'-5' exoribonuclease